MDKKGLSGIIATLLLVTVGIIAFISLQQWYLNNSSELLSKVEEEGGSSDLTEISEVSGYTIIFRNFDNRNHSVDKITIDDTTCNYSKQLEEGFNEIDISNCSNIESGINEVSVHTNRGIYSKSLQFSFSSCSLDGITVDNNQNYTFYNQSQVGLDETCSSQTRECKDGTFTGDDNYNHSSCSKEDQDTTPQPFSFTNQSGVSTSTVIESNTLTPTGFDGPLSVGITGNGSPQLRVGSGSWVTSDQMNLTDNLTIRLNSSNNFNTYSYANLTLGNYSTIWNVTTGSQAFCEGNNVTEYDSLCWYNNMNAFGTLEWAVTANSTYSQPTYNGNEYVYPTGTTESDYPAFEACNTLDIDGYDNWRLPTLEELDDKTCDDDFTSANGFSDCVSNYYWTQNESSASYAFRVYLVNGNSNNVGKGIANYVACVRQN